jgi:hypothetical protein
VICHCLNRWPQVALVFTVWVVTPLHGGNNMSYSVEEQVFLVITHYGVTLCYSEEIQEMVWWLRCHRSQESVEVIKSFSQDWIISNNLCHPGLRDLTSPDFFLWGYPKERVYRNKPCTIKALKDSIWLEISNTENDVLCRTTDNMQCWVQLCLEEGATFITWCKVIQLIMNSCVCYLSFTLFCAHTTELQASVTGALYMDNPVHR